MKPIVFLAASVAAMATSLPHANAEPIQAPSLAVRLPVMMPRVIAWAEKLASEGGASGIALTPEETEIARGSGVREPGRIRLVIVERIPLPEEAELKAAALTVGLSQSSALGMTVGYAVVVRRGFEDNVRLLSHEFRHVAQYEACGGIRPFLAMHLADLAAFGYEDSPFEVDARAHERDSAPARRHLSSGR